VKKSWGASTVWAYAVLLLAAVFSIGPLYIALCAASSTSHELLSGGMTLLPGGELLANLKEVTHRTNMGQMLFNSLVVSTLVVIGKLALSSITAFAVVYFRFPLRGPVFAVVFLTLLLPLEVRIVPTYAVVSNVLEPFNTILSATHLDSLLAAIAGIRVLPSLNLLDTYAGLSLPIIASATGTFLFRQFYETVPPEISEAARIDGIGPIRFYIDILLPLSKANFAALGTIVFISTWKDYMWPLVSTSQQSMRTVVMGVASFLPTEASQLPEWNLMMAAALIACVPPLIVIALMQRWFVKGIVGASK
jgi:sn-glycerol 3-phosphate transport system permease protein